MDETIEQLYRTRLFYSDVVADYEKLVRSKDLVLGYRLHGNLMALANRVPSIYFTYDSRTTEFAETFAIPSHPVFAERPFRLEDYWDQALFDRFNRAYYACYREMCTFLEENGIDHRMHAGTGRSAPVRRVA
jgi:polysaccharide pyruvyl transferase WcaK-like protein